jgi:hypothetical protein
MVERFQGKVGHLGNAEDEEGQYTADGPSLSTKRLLYATNIKISDRDLEAEAGDAGYDEHQCMNEN